MAANRSRTSGWKHSLEQLIERQSSVEIAVARHFDEETGECHLMWRVRLLGMDEKGLIVEQPSTLGQTIHLEDGIELITIYSVGQNRWMFRTKCLGRMNHEVNPRRRVAALLLEAPESVDRLQRRNYHRLETDKLRMPKVEIWPLLNPKSVVVAERANELRFREAMGENAPTAPPKPLPFNEDLMPEVGPKFVGSIVNIGGGGIGLRINPDQAQALNRYKLFWMRFTLSPDMPAPICGTGKLTHTHMESSHCTYAGMAFDFSFNPDHQNFVVEQICGYVANQQRLQLQRQRKVDSQRRSA